MKRATPIVSESYNYMINPKPIKIARTNDSYSNGMNKHANTTNDNMDDITNDNNNGLMNSFITQGYQTVKLWHNSE